MEELNCINLNDYRIFYVVCKTLNFTKDSEMLNISQLAIEWEFNYLKEKGNYLAGI